MTLSSPTLPPVYITNNRTPRRLHELGDRALGRFRGLQQPTSEDLDEFIAAARAAFPEREPIEITRVVILAWRRAADERGVSSPVAA